MKMRFPDRNYIVFCSLFTVSGLLSLVVPASIYVHVLLATIYAIGNGWLTGDRFMPEEGPFWRSFLGLLLFTSLVILIGSGVYFLFSLSTLMTALVILSVPAGLTLAGGLLPTGTGVPFNGSRESKMTSDAMHPAVRAVGVLVAVALVALAFYASGLLDGSATDISIRSPWDSVPRMFFIVVFMLSASVIAAAAGRLSGPAALAPLVGLALIATTVAVKIYSVGFGFDPFIHQATEQHIFEFGQMTPKPFYYLGQYTLVTIAARMVGGHIAAIDAYLTPIFFSLVPLVAYWSLRKSFGWPQSISAAASATLLVLPLSSFIMTTPQGLANAILLMTSFVCMAFIVARAVPGWMPVLLALAAVSIHPLAGVPLFMFVLLVLYLDAYDGPLKRLPGIARWTVFLKLVLVASVCLPLLFLVNSIVSGVGVTFDSETVRTPVTIIEELKRTEIETRKFSAMLDFVYSWRSVRWLVLLLMGVAGTALLYLSGIRNDSRKRAALAFGTGAFAFLANFVLLKVWVEFPFLIEYERANFADRLSELTLFILAPVALYAFGRLLLRMRRSGFPALATGMIIMVAAVTVASVYLAYPRRDKYESSRGWSTSAFDVESVLSIDEDARGVSAAAVKEFGFMKYFESLDPDYPEDVFFYPIPTGGRLYDFFLEMNDEKGAREIAEGAMDLAGVDTTYYVVNHYWWAAQGIIINAKTEADNWWEVDERNWVFKYVR
jgi:hypothetical protein